MAKTWKTGFGARFYFNVLESVLSCFGLKFSDGVRSNRNGMSNGDGKRKLNDPE